MKNSCLLHRTVISLLWLWLASGITVPVRVLADESANTLPATVTIQQLLEITREKSPRYAALRQRIESAGADVVAAGVLPNPTISYGRFDLLTSRNTMYDGNVQQQVTLEVPVLVAGQRGARVEAAEKQEEATAADIEAEFAGLVHEVWGLFIKQLADKQRIVVLNETAQYMDHLVEIVSGRSRAGNASRYDLLRIEIEAKSVKTQLETVRNSLSATAGDLGVLLGLSGWKPQAVGDLAYLGVPADLNKLWAEAERMNPDLEAARRGEAAADAGLERASRERWPVPSFQVGTVFTDKPYGNTSFAGVSVDLPIFDRGQGGMARAAAEKRSAALGRAFATARTRSALERAVELLVRRRETRAMFERDVMGKLADLKEMGEASYRLGKGSLLELLDASRSRTETRLTHLDLIQSEIEAELEVLRSSGSLINSVETELAKS
jgi:cobalt-zinc-cadmium efflux system outer membrane protein